MAETGNSSYDSIAEMYHALWADWYLPAAMPALERLLFSQIPAGARVLDLCCGSGHVTKELVARGYRVTGVDNSAELIGLAKRDLPAVDFQVQDARNLTLDESYQAVLSTFDSLNHVLSLGELGLVFAGVYRTLAPGGLFVFDMNLQEAYSADLRQWAVDLQDKSVGLVRGKYDWETGQAKTELIWFTRQDNGDCWRQFRSVVEQRCYPQSEIIRKLTESGFKSIEALKAKDAGVTSELGFGRLYFAAERAR